MGKWRFRPRLVPQKEKRLCWAASIESYTYATHGVRKTRWKYARDTARLWGCTEADDTLINDANTYRMLNTEYGLTNDVSERSAEKRHNRVDMKQKYEDIVRDQLTPDYFEEKLKYSHVIFAYYKGAGVDGDAVWHTVVVYGTDGNANGSFCYMDPLQTGRGMYKKAEYRCLRYFDSSEILDYISFWRKT